MGIFFTLSGFLITSILLNSFKGTGTMQFKRFWLHRARRLLPALVVMVAVVLLTTALWNPLEFHDRLVSTLSALLYVNNWVTIHQGVSYFARFSAPGPLDHLWSLSVEEQFYFFWPFVLLGLLTLCKGRATRMALITLGMAVVSFVLLLATAHVGFDNTRAYEGTDTRAGGLLIGAAVAMLWQPSRRPRRQPLGARLILDAVGIVALAVIVEQITATNQYSISIYHTGILALSVATAALVAVVVHPGADANAVLGIPPLRFIGERSYGIYLWQLPIIVACSGHLFASNALVHDVVVCGLILLAASLSWRYVEDPIRTHGFTQAWSMLRASLADARHRGLGLVAPLLAGSLVVTVGVGAASVHGAKPVPTTLPPVHIKPVKYLGLKTRCTVVTQDGDSTSDGLISPDYLPNPADRLPAQLARVGVKVFHSAISGAQSINETWHGQPNAQERVTALVHAGVHGCWIFALGTNDSADVAVGSSVSMPKRIALMMALVPHQPVLWLSVKSLPYVQFPYNDDQMQQWNHWLLEACKQYPNMRIYDWRSEVLTPWYQTDGIHFTSYGYYQRAVRIADALAHAFPLQSASPKSCIVSSGVPG